MKTPTVASASPAAWAGMAAAQGKSPSDTTIVSDLPPTVQTEEVAMTTHHDFHTACHSAYRHRALGLLLCGTAALPALAQPQLLACPESAIRHWDKIVFMISDHNVANLLRVPAKSELDIKVLDDPTKVADLKQKVMDFFRPNVPANLADYRKHIEIVSVAYAISGCVMMPSGPTPGQTSCSSTVTSGPGQTSATAICGLSCPSAHVTAYVGAGTPFVSFVNPQYVCNGQPTIGTSSITCSC